MDTLRGFGIALVIWGHQKPDRDFLAYLQGIMLALFIFASGFLFNGGKYPNARTFLKRRARMLLIPYLWFTLFSFLFWVFLWAMGQFAGGDFGVDMVSGADAGQAMASAKKLAENAQPGPLVLLFWMVIATIYGSGSLMLYNIPMWFFPGLFVIDALFYWLWKKSATDRSLLLKLIALSVLGYFLGVFKLRLPWNIDTACSVVLYYGLGYLFRKRYGEGWKMSVPVKIPVAAAALALSVYVIVWHNAQAHPSFNGQGNYFYYHIGSLTSIVAFMLISQLLAKLKRPAGAPPLRSVAARLFWKVSGAIPGAFNYIARNAVMYIGGQVITMGLFMTFNRLVFGIMAREKMYSTHWALYYSIGAILLMVPFNYVVNRWAPFILGGKRTHPRPATAPKPAK